ncbi:MAG: Methionyl-tRNA formyltransferase [Parcubacteria group bacterium GW2011_GWA1_43_21]|uniref:methionyl-tRNA formyltransferase n=1 Tax=Candidatus Vogelbacteria bacterium RIFOXYB1_FULL_42_16 TaxID=1802436 RepID=A0A1G2QG53_9BACT|nr:MAG: Methionyl-tRNA formyltransferase [Parcubacteria group bacterium GW2011_GWB1_42_9]KKT10137.1 MAG: Methionyl-tRNA formyltransferase [Parcubacteria group bacterium GW2011_GWA1_43_21]OHA59029.1 MAG: methionyl-tRNA formyltransferase [Candidatus Vogelbacteria bacterium RIFOXYB1_FULL_42_16]
MSDNKPTFVFFGTDEFSVQVLETLREDNLIPSLIITVPDKPKGRKMVLTPPPVKTWAEANEIEVIQPASLTHLEVKPPSELIEKLKVYPVAKNLNFSGTGAITYNLFLVASYGQIIPRAILDLPKNDTLNIHPSLLPKYRGPSPLETVILNGDRGTGVTIIKLDAEMDHGPIIAQEKFSLDDKNDFISLRDKSARLGAEMLIKILPAYLAGEIVPQEQDHSQATLTKKFTKEDGYLNPNDTDLVNWRKILALNPWPGAYILIEKDDLKIRLAVKSAHLDDQGQLIYDRVVPAGKKEMSWSDFQHGLK